MGKTFDASRQSLKREREREKRSRIDREKQQLWNDGPTSLPERTKLDLSFRFSHDFHGKGFVTKGESLRPLWKTFRFLAFVVRGEFEFPKQERPSPNLVVIIIFEIETKRNETFDTSVLNIFATVTSVRNVWLNILLFSLLILRISRKDRISLQFPFS